MTVSTEPVEGLRPPDEGPGDRIRSTRPKLALWDRIKFLMLFAIAFLVLVWASMADNPLLPFVDAMRIQLQERWWILALAGLEVLRQIHFLISEHWSGYHRFWTNKVFGGFERTTHRRFSDWTRFRLARALKWLFWIAFIAVVAGAVLDTSPFLALFQAPALIWQALPFILQGIFLLFIVVMQFVAIFWFLSRGGVETYYPDDVKTRFSDVWGQDHVLEKVKENIVFLENPESIESKGGYVPGGILLWGPPGTGKTLMAEAVAGETGKPYVFVDPGAFTNMFMGVGILKVKSLFRKLRKLALRYGGVIVFLDEADSLGSRGAISQGPGFPRGATPAPFSAGTGCHGFSYLSSEAQTLLTRSAMRPRGGAGAAQPVRHGRHEHGRWRRHGHAAGAAHRDVRPQEAARLRQPVRSPAARHAAQAAAEVPDPDHDGVQPARGAGRGPAAAGPHRPHVQGGLPHQGRADPHVRGLPVQGAPRADTGGDRQARHDLAVRHRREDQGHRQRGPDLRHPRRPRCRSPGAT